jgi:putative membrane-bound dehydrogenase-like protein
MNPAAKPLICSLIAAFLGSSSGWAAPSPSASFTTNVNRLTYLEEDQPFYPGLAFPRLVTPQWIGEPGVEAVVILSIDDLRETDRYERFLRPIIERLKQIDGRAPVSILVNAIAPTNAQLSGWLKEGLSLEVHTLAHPCPCLAKGDFDAAANTYHGCVELMNQIPGNKPVAFRMPCCDSMNSPSPRFYSEIFNRTNAAGQFLTIDSSVMNIITPNDPSLPRRLVVDADGRGRFRKYLPAHTNATTRVSMGSFTTTIEDYPYPYVLGNLCWEFPAIVPSDWEAFNLHGATNAATLADWKAALDTTVLKQGVFTFIFHPHGWSSSAQFVEFIDYAVRNYGRKVKFLSFREAQERLNKHLLAGNSLRSPNGADEGVRLIDLNNDGYLDVVIGNTRIRQTRVWDRENRRWDESNFPSDAINTRFGVMTRNGPVVAINPRVSGWQFDQGRWIENRSLLQGLALDEVALKGPDQGVRFRDIDADGHCELIVANTSQNLVFSWSDADGGWKKKPYSLPQGTSIVDAEGRDAGLRFVDVNEDGYDDVLFSNGNQFSLHLFVPRANQRLMWDVGWNEVAFSGKRGESGLNIPMVVRDGVNRNNGVWFANKTMWIQNEDTAHLPDKVDRRTFKQLLSADQPQAMSPQESLKAMRVRPGFKVELVASEPTVTDPIAFDWGADGKLWIVEMVDYPLGKKGDGKPGGRIKFLEDLDGDGLYEKASVFLDGVNFPTGVMPWRNGVLVAAAPEIFYAEDIDHDGIADKKETLFTGFAEGNQQHRLNGFDYGLDNWVYGANGDSGGTIRWVGKRFIGARSAEAAVSRVDIRGRDFRFQPDTGQFQAIAGQTQFGRHRDDWDNWFGNNNPTWLWHYHVPEHYLARNPHLGVKSTKKMLADYPESTRLYPASRTRQRFNDHHQFNHVTSANSATPYRDDLFGPDFSTSVFISDPVHNVVHREVLDSDGVSFTSRRSNDETKSEFLASADNWFRPIMLRTGPDGALYVADMYRQVLEHPEWIPAHVKPRLDLRAGEDKGRIYRVYPTTATLPKVPRLDRMSTTALVSALDSSNGWQRDTAQRLLVQSGDSAAVEPLTRLVQTNANAKTRLQALCTLDGLGAVTPQIAMLSWKDAHPEVRAHGIRISERFGEEWTRRLRSERGCPELNILIDDPAIKVRYQLAFSLGEWNGSQFSSLLLKLALREFNNPQMQAAIMSSAPKHVVDMLGMVLARRGEAPEGLLQQLLGLAAAMKLDDAMVMTLSEAARPAASGTFETWQFTAMAAFLDVLERRNESFEQFTTKANSPLKDVLTKLERLFPEAQAIAGRSTAGEQERVAAIGLLGKWGPQRENDIKQLVTLLQPEHSPTINHAAVSTLSSLKQQSAAEAMLAGWKSYPPSLREEVLAKVLSRADWTRTLLDAMERQEITRGQINAVWQQKLLKHRDVLIRERSAKQFSATRVDREALMQDYAGVNKLKGDPQKGFALFRGNCSSCHRLGGEGSAVGPDLGMISDKTLAALLVAILDPNQAVEARYVSYTAVTKGDHEVSGIIIAETRNSITLRTISGNEETLLRADLKDLTTSGLSMMPEGLEKALDPQGMADLIAALQARK